MNKGAIATFLLFILTIFSYSTHACNKSVDSDDVIVMYDLNFIFQEVEAARRAACERGQSLVVLPYGYEKHKELGEYKEVAYRNKTWAKNNKCTESSTSSKCKRYKEKLELADKAFNRTFDQYKKEHGNIYPDDDFEKLADKGKRITSMILSGHDGSGNFSANGQSISKELIVEAYKDHFDYDNPEDDPLKSLCLWGCYTATPAEIKSWTDQLPSVDMIAGFHGSGPSIGKTASVTALEDFLVQEGKIVQEQNAARLDRRLKAISNINYTLAAAYVKTCNNREYYLSHEKYKQKGKTKYARNFDEFTLECGDRFKEQYEKHYAEFLKYYHGEKPIPKDTTDGELRYIYNFARQSAHCIEELYPDSLLTETRAGLLLFFDGVKENFYANFEDELQDLRTTLKELMRGKTAMYGKGIASFPGWLANSALLLLSDDNDIKKLAKDAEKLLPLIPKNKEEFKKMNRKDFRTLATKLDGMVSHDAHTWTKGGFTNDHNLRKMRNAINQYAYELSSDCMDFMEWHELDPFTGEPAVPECTIHF